MMTIPSHNPNQGKMRRLTASDGHVFDAWEVTPPSPVPCRAAIIVVQEIFGLTSYIRSVCAFLAEQGYHVLAPALFDRIAPNTLLPYTEKGVEDGLALRARLPAHGARRDIEACLEALKATHDGHRKIGIIGFCWGGLLAWQTAQELPVDAAECWYGGEIASHCDPAPHCPVELHFGEDDSYIPPSDWDTIRIHCPDTTLYVYEGTDHGFGCTDRASYNKQASDLAWQRSLAFFKKHLS